MDRRTLQQHKKTPKVLSDLPSFSPLRKHTLPGQYRRLGRPRAQGTNMITVSESHRVLFIWRDGAILTDRSFYAYLIELLSGGNFRTLLEFHWHPSHKGFHCVTPCGSDADYTNRMLHGCTELKVKTRRLDSAKAADRLALIEIFCRICGITIDNPHDGQSARLWN
ncbi:hypothetical protein [Bordetella genomosp. 5]|uniref:hypothetical protein n=1 Tax=Bordetella genomosp. 5 TaxID=1395608 RepID=UPI0011405403|nr:hypothetical protein [Bordetella genomosp. 5]